MPDDPKGILPGQPQLLSSMEGRGLAATNVDRGRTWTALRHAWLASVAARVRSALARRPICQRGSCEARLTGVLLAEDDRTIGELMKAAITDGSYRVDRVLDGESALSGFETHTNYVVVLNLGLPKKWGYRFGRNSHEEPSGTRTGYNSVRCR
jgi:hypothetical protein